MDKRTRSDLPSPSALDDATPQGQGRSPRTVVGYTARSSRWLGASLVLAMSLVGLVLAACNRDSPGPTVSSSTVPALSAAGSASVYTCPMHPSVVSDKPGKCPECGMNLVAAGPSASAGGAGHEHH